MFQRGNKVLIVELGLIITTVFLRDLLAEALGLIFGIVQLAKAVTQLTATDKEFKAVGDLRVIVVTPRQRGYLGRVLGNKGRMPQLGFQIGRASCRERV